MGTITRSFANNITTSGVLLPASLTNNSIANVTAYNASVSTGGMVLLSTQTASNSASLSFTSSINSTYKEYQFWFIDIVGRTQRANLEFNLSTDGGSNYNVAKTSTFFATYINEAGNDVALTYQSSYDLAQGTGNQNLVFNISNTGQGSGSGLMSLFNPASTTYVKHFISTASHKWITSDFTEFYTGGDYVAGYGNTTSAINAVRFQMSSGNMDGTILMYGVK
jgi:hypothetical protein